MDEIIRTIQFNPYMESYQGFFCSQWKASFLKMIQHSRLRDPGYDLSRTWEAISNARQLPWLMVKCLDDNFCERLETFQPWDCRKIRIVGDKLVAKLEKLGERIRPMFRKKLQRAIKELSEEIDEMRSDVAKQVLGKQDNLWDKFIKHDDFNTSLWGLERMCYGGLYYGYEWYLAHCFRLKKGNPKLRWQWGKTLVRDFDNMFGKELTDLCLNDEEIQIARKTRNALVHNGGRITPELKELQHTFRLEGEEIQINAEHTTSLFHKLKDRVYGLTESAIKMPEFL